MNRIVMMMQIPAELKNMLSGSEGESKQKAARLIIDLAAVSGATEFIRCDSAHVSGVSVLKGGHGMRTFLSDLSSDQEGKV